MPASDALKLAREYHEAWTRGDVRAAGRLLADDVEIEVPVNDYATKQSFLAAVELFGGASTGQRMLAALGSADDAVLVYDMDVPGLGTLRVAEHFTAADGHITRIRQIHDTHAIRAAGLAA